MITDYTTRDGIQLKIGRVERQSLVTFLRENQPPKPPVKKVIVFGGITEDVEVKDDPKYLVAMAEYNASIYQKQFDVIYPAVSCCYDAYIKEMYALYEIGVPRGVLNSDILHYVVLSNTKDANFVCDAVVYNSTVTGKAIQEAYTELSVKWLNREVQFIRTPMSPASTGAEFEAMRAAKYCNVGWDSFCKMSGPEQSKLVAFYRLDNKLEWLRSNKK